MKPRMDRLFRLVGYVGVGLFLAILLSLLAWYDVSSGRNTQSSIGWLGLVTFTPVIFWAAVKPLRKCWKRPTFWLAVTGLLAVHLLAFVTVLRYFPEWRLVWFIPVGMMEVWIFGVILDQMFTRSVG